MSLGQLQRDPGVSGPKGLLMEGGGAGTGAGWGVQGVPLCVRRGVRWRVRVRACTCVCVCRRVRWGDGRRQRQGQAPLLW